MENQENQEKPSFGYLQRFADQLLKVNEDFTFDQVRELYLKILISDFEFHKHLVEKHGFNLCERRLIVLRAWAFLCGIRSNRLTTDLREVVIDLP